MKLENEFRVDVPVEEAWRVLLDVERIAPCMPGAQLQEVEGDEYRGIVKIKVGPITAQYKGAARIIEVDDANHRAVLRAEGRDTRGQGNASATVTTTLQADGGGTRVSIDSDVTITGKVSQFGRGVITDVSAKLLDQFVACLERDVLSTPSEAAAETSQSSEAAPEGVRDGDTASGGARMVDSPEAQPVDLLRAAGAPVLKRLIPAAVVIIVVVVVVLIVLLR
jgi:carbon monoxide dehydrogenase subunit G